MRPCKVILEEFVKHYYLTYLMKIRHKSQRHQKDTVCGKHSRNLTKKVNSKQVIILKSSQKD